MFGMKKKVGGASAPLYPVIPKDAILWSDDLRVMYDDSVHSYTMGGKKLLSATGLINEYKPPFNGTTDKTERDLGMTKEGVLAMWKAKGDVATNRGDYIHWLMEVMLSKWITARKMVEAHKLDKELAEYVSVIWKALGKRELRKCLKLENVLYSVKYQLAGRADCIVANENTAHIVDWKTNRSDLHKAYGRMKPPIEGMMASKLEQYKIQIGIYAVMYEEMTNKEVTKGTIVHLDKGVVFISVDMAKYKALAKSIMAHYVAKRQ
jgi:hypothetical protein